MPFQQVAPLFIDHFRMEMKIAYQSMGLNLPNTSTLISGFKGNQFFYPKMGTITFRPITPGQQIDPQSAKVERIAGLLEPTGAQIIVDDIEESFTNVMLRAPLVKNLTDASRRRMDQVLIDAVTDSTDVEITDIPDGGVNLNLDKILKVAQEMNARAIPPQDRVLLISARADTLLMNDPSFTSNDFFDKGAIMRGTFDGALIFGLRIIVVPDNVDEGGLKKVGNVVTCLAYHKLSVGYARGMSTRISIDEVPLFLNDTVIQMKMTLDSIVIDGLGVFRIGADVS